jgi:D-alanyl-D-alanine carboxypeptidase
MNNGYSREEAERIAATVSAIPGTSEHQLGLAVDIIDTGIWGLVQEQEDLAGQQWLMENCWRYGFILRYPKNKTDETGIIYEPWHYRYVGIELAEELRECGLTLEAYLAALS